MATEATALGSHFQRSTDGGTTYTNVAQVLSIKPPKVASTDVKYDILDGTGYTQYLPGQTDPGTVTLVVAFDPTDAGHSGLWADSLPPQPSRNYKIVLPDAKAYTFAGYIKDFEQGELKAESLQEATVTIQVNGAITLA